MYELMQEVFVIRRMLVWSWLDDGFRLFLKNADQEKHQQRKNNNNFVEDGAVRSKFESSLLELTRETVVNLLGIALKDVTDRNLIFNFEDYFGEVNI